MGFSTSHLGRNVDVLVMPASDLDDAVLPSGRLREPLDAASSADCVLVPGSLEDVSRVAATFDRMPVFRVTNHFGSRSRDWTPPRRRVRASLRSQASHAPSAFSRRFANRDSRSSASCAFRITTGFRQTTSIAFARSRKKRAPISLSTTEKDAVRVSPQTGWAVLPMTAVDRAGRAVFLMASGTAVRYRLEFAFARSVQACLRFLPMTAVRACGGALGAMVSRRGSLSSPHRPGQSGAGISIAVRGGKRAGVPWDVQRISGACSSS